MVALADPPKPTPGPPRAAETRMPLRPENVRMTLLLAATVLLAVVGVFGATAVAIWGGSNSTPTIVYIGGLVLLATKLLLGMLLAELDRREIKAAVRDTRTEVERTQAVVNELAERTDGGLTRAVREVGEQVRAAERDQVLPEVMGHPQFEAMLARVADEAVRRWCSQPPPGG